MSKKRAFILCKFENSASPHVQRIGINGEPQAQLELGFYSSKGGGKGFLRFRTPDWVSRGVLVSVYWQVILSTVVGMLGISFGWSVLGWCLGNLSLWSFLQPGIVSE